jgi:hypothetical protein
MCTTVTPCCWARRFAGERVRYVALAPLHSQFAGVRRLLG